MLNHKNSIINTPTTRHSHISHNNHQSNMINNTHNNHNTLQQQLLDIDHNIHNCILLAQFDVIKQAHNPQFHALNNT